MAVAPILGFVGMATQFAGGLAAASGQAAGYRYAAAEAERRALAARTAADQTDAQFRTELSTTLGNIQAIRAAAGVTPDSPTGLAINDKQNQVSDTQRLIKVDNYLAQSAQSESDAQFYSGAASNALGIGFLSAFGKGISGLSGMRG